MNRSKGFAVVVSAIAGALLWGNGASTTDVQAAQTQLSTVPVAGTGQAVPKPNVMLLMDTSRSMAFTHMPDELEFPGGNPSYEMPIGYRSAQCNALYYDPAKVYEVPRGADGYYLVNPPTNVDFGAARYDFYSSGTANTDLSTSFRAYDRNTRQLQIANDAEDPAQPAYYYTYEGTQALRYDAAPCTDMESVRFAGVNLAQSNVTASTTGGLWRRKLVTSSSGTGTAGVDERRNFAIWYTFYRTRMAMVKSSISLAFNPINDGFRVGLVSMNPLVDTNNADSGVSSTKYLAIDDFNDTQKAAWYAKLYGQTPDGSSPAREGLARVGRHYAGRADGINANMTPDPVRYTCQQNFTIMTTDGYWNTAQETRGPVAIDGTTRVGNQDGNLTSKTILDRFDPLLYTHRPIWDGTTSGSRTDTTTSTMNRYQPCDSGEFFRTVSVVSRATSQPTQRTQSLTKTTEQIFASTVQTSRSTTQDQKTTTTETRESLQALASTQQMTRATRQELETHTWMGRGTSKVYATTTQKFQTTSYTQKSVSQIQMQTRTQTMSQTRLLQTQEQTTKTTAQSLQSTSQVVQTDTTTSRSTTQPLIRRTVQLQSTSQQFQRTTQMLAYNGSTETTTPVASCTNSGNISCLTLTTGPTAVASCTAQPASAGNNFVTRTCDTPATTGPTAVQTCTAQSAVQGNNYVTTTCNTQVTGPTPAASCTTASPSAGNGWADIVCSTNTTGPTPVAPASSCVAGTDASFTTTTCTPVVVTKGVDTCKQGTDSTTKTVTTCATKTAGPTGVQSCTPTTRNAGNSWLTTTCTPKTTTAFTTKASCKPISADASNNWTETTCNTVTTGTKVQVNSCAVGVGSSPNYFATTACDTEKLVTNQAVASCVASGPSDTNSHINTTCGGATFSSWSNVGSCVIQAPTSLNGYLERACQETTPTVTQVLPTQCTPVLTSGGQRTTCQAVVLPEVAVSDCTPNTTGPSFVSCRTVTTPETLVASCTPGGGQNTNWLITTCRTETTPEQNVQTCTPANAGSGNGNTATVCFPHTETVPVAPGSCVAKTGNAGNNWVTTTCPAPATTGPAGVPLGSCSNVAASATNAWTQTICTMNGPTTPTPVASCTGGTNATTYTVTTCTNTNTPVTRVVPGSCTAQLPTPGNGYTTVNCVPNTRTVGVAAGSCVAQTPDATNNFTKIACATVTSGPTFVAQGSCTAGTSGTFVTTSCNTTNTGPTLVAACTEGVDADFKVTSCSVNTSQPQQLTPGSACTSEGPTSANNFTRTTCTANDTTVGVAADTCVPSPRGVLPVVSCATATTSPTPVAACTPGTDSTFLTTTCTANTQGPDRVTSCSAVAPTAGNGYTSTTCVSIPGTKVQSRTQTTTATYDVSGDTAIDSSVRNKTTTETDWTDVGGGICYASPAAPPVVDVSGAWGGTTTTKGPVTGTGLQGSIDSLADVAQYYYVTDLRPSMSNDIPRLGEGIEDDRAPWQHMTTFVVGLGVSGNLNYQENYKSAITGDFSKIRSYENTPPVNWPIWPNGTNLSQLQYNDPRSIDDFWHTAVNGRGKYFSARDPQSVVDGLKEALSGIKAQAGAGAGASVSSLTPTAGDNIAYTGSFTTLDWTGELQAQELDTVTGSLSTTVRWSARSLLDAKVGDECDNRKIYARDPSTNNLVDFTWNTSACDTTSGLPTGSATTGLTAAMKTAFTDSAITTGLSQFPFMSDGSAGTIDQRTATTGANLLNYLRGQRKREGYVSNTAKLYRARAHVLGDIVNSQPAYVKAPSQFFQDADYDAFKTTNKARTPMVYVGANDGMLHAFYAPANSTDPNYANAGQEAWAFVPQVVMPNMWNLADMNYADKHQFFVDGSPIAGDVRTGGQWRTMVVAGLGHGGNGYYALDVTNPAAPRAMWEFNMNTACATNPIGATSDCNVGLTYGRPIITKLRDGTWVVLVTSGYNNSVSGDGRGYLYVLNAGTGAIIQRIATSSGSKDTPSGLREINIFVNNYALNNTAERAYGADLLGNIWRFDINNVLDPTGYEAALLATAKDKSNNPQPISTRPQLAEVNGTTMVLAATGRLLSTDDLTDTSAQTVYAFQDPLTNVDPSVYSNLRTELRGLELVQTGSGSTATRTVKCAATGDGACTQTKGWYIDLPDTGERVNVDMQSVLGTLVFASNVPSNTMCSGGGYSWLNYVDLITGEPVSSSENRVTSVQFFGNSVVVGLGIIGLPDGTFRALGRDASGAPRSVGIPVGSPPPQGKRISWRELVR